ncbi:hypothetical protein GCM10027431_26410 [Lysobacter rhizosphaerae]
MNNAVSKCGFGTLERPLYSPGQLLEDEDLSSGVSYTRRLTQLLFSSLFGCGVICGLRVSAEKACDGRKLKILVGSGLGLDCLGNPIEVPSQQELYFDPKCDPFPDSLWVVACYRDHGCAPRELSSCHDGGNETAMTRQKQGFEIKVYGEKPKCACSCYKAEKAAPAGAGDPCCQGGTPASSSGTASTSGTVPTDGKKDVEGCYDDHVKGVCPCGCDCTCILIGVVTPTLVVDVALDADRSGVRDIRPFLVGHYHRLEESGRFGTPATPTPPPPAPTP